jgi:hypothetical protein
MNVVCVGNKKYKLNFGGKLHGEKLLGNECETSGLKKITVGISETFKEDG